MLEVALVRVLLTVHSTVLSCANVLNVWSYTSSRCITPRKIALEVVSRVNIFGNPVGERELC